MIKRFQTVVPLEKEIAFRFEPVNILKLQLFQVYFTYDGREIRFHMQKEANAQEFKITDPFRFPDKMLEQHPELEPVLSDAIFLHCS